MDRKLRILYYRGVRYTTQFFAKKANVMKEITYRGASFIKDMSAKHITSHATMSYRGVAY